MDIILSFSPEDLAPPPEKEHILKAYKIGDGHLYRHNSAPEKPKTHAGLSLFPEYCIDLELLLPEIFFAFERCPGLFCFFDPSPELEILIKELDLHFGRRLYVRDGFAGICASARLLVSTAISGGWLAERFAFAAASFGKGRILAEYSPLSMDFTLPAPSGKGTEISAERLNFLLGEFKTAVFFSDAFCLNYFSYISCGEYHFVLFDNELSLSKKMAVLSGIPLVMPARFSPQTPFSNFP